MDEFQFLAKAVRQQNATLKKIVDVIQSQTFDPKIAPVVRAMLEINDDLHQVNKLLDHIDLKEERG